MAQDNNGNDTANFFFSKEQINEKLKNVTLSVCSDYYDRGYGTCFCSPTVSYICPKCGIKTLYPSEYEHFMTSFGKQEFVWNKNGGYFEPKFFDRETYIYVLDEIKNCRERIKKIKGIHIALDESEFCKYCSPSIIKPTLYLLVNIDGERYTARTSNITYKDIRLLESFLNDNTVYIETDKTSSAKYIKRLKELLGIKYD